MRFFFYGTLMAGSGNEVARAVHGRLGPGVAAVVSGKLYGIPDPQGWYPALVTGAGGVVRGFVHEAAPDFTEADLAALEDWEGPEYARFAVAVVRGDGARVIAQAFVWAGALPEGAEEISGGDFAAFIAERGLTAFGEGG